MRELPNITEAEKEIYGRMPSMRDGLTVSELEKMLSDLRYQPIWRPEADKACDYYDSHQLTEERLAKMERLGIPPLITNLIAPAINAVLGMEAKTRTDWRVTQEDEAQDVPELVLNAMNAKLSEAERETRADRAISDAYASEVKAGLGWVEVSRPVDVFDYPYRVQPIHRNEIWFDWRSKRADLLDARYLVRKRRFDCDELIALMPEHKDLIKFAINDAFSSWQFDTRESWSTDLAYASYIERVTNIDSNDWRDADRHRVTLYEVWYRKWTRGKVVQLPNGRTIPFNKKDPRHVAAANVGLLQPFDGVYATVRVAIYLGPHRLYDNPSPYRHRYFPYVPFWGFREDRSGVPYGLIRAMISPQDVVNAADAKMHWMLNARRLTLDSDKLDEEHNTLRQVQDELGRPDAVIVTDPNKRTSELKIETNFELNQQQFSRRMQAASDIENAGGIYKAMLGKDSSASSGIAINSLVEQGNIMLSEINDNYAFARRIVGDMLFSLVRDDMMRPDLRVGFKKNGKRKVVVLNQRIRDEQTGEESIANDVASVPSKVVLEDVPSTPAFRAQQLQMITQITSSLPPAYQAVVADMVIALTDVPQKEKYLERIRKVGGIESDDLTPEEEQAQADAANQEMATDKNLQRSEIQATTDLKNAQAELARTKAAGEEVAIIAAQHPPVETQPPADIGWR